MVLLLASLAVVAGIGAGVCLGLHETFRQMRGRLEQFAARTIAEADASSAEARRVLDTIHNSPLAACSVEDVHNLRRLIFESESLKDAGRVRADQIACSAIASTLANPAPLPKPSFTSPDGLNAYDYFVPPDGGGAGAFALGQNGAYVVFSPHIEEHRAAPPIRYLSSGIDDPHPGMVAGWSELGRNVLTTNSSGQKGRILYATACSSQFYNCVTGWVPAAEAAQLNRRLIAVYTALGGLCGMLVGILGIFLRARGWEMHRQLRGAIRRKEIELLYQPIVSLGTGRMVGAEALARWKDRDGNPVSPEVFIPLAVRHGLIAELTRLVVHRALGEMRELLQLTDFQLAVNVTAEDLADRRSVEMLRTVTREAGVEPGRVAIEVTESSTARGTEAETTIQRLHDAGYCVHIDDFGTGYSSLAYLQDLAVDAIKIDRTFTRAVGTGAANAAVLPRVLAMAGALNLEVVVEGIETETQLEYFVSTGLPLKGQGWLFGRPVTAAELRRRLVEERRDAGPSSIRMSDPGQSHLESKSIRSSELVP